MHRLSDYDYPLPAELIAQAPADRRDASRLLVVGPDSERADRRFADIVELLPADAVVVINDTRVFPARLRTTKPTGGAVELLFLERVDAQTPGASPGARPDTERWRCMARSSKPLRPGTRLALAAAPDEHILIVGGRDRDATVVVELRGPAHDLLERHGEVPLPPYIERPDGAAAADAARYQTVYAREPGAVAAPTAGLHFTGELLAALRARGAAIAPITLHVGMGTFAPVRVDDLTLHHMHTERYRIDADSARLINQALAHGRPVVAVGTTCVRALESAALRAGRPVIEPGEASTELFIRPGFAFQVVDLLVTNFHLPRSTLLMLVCAFAGPARMMAAYQHAVAAGYRFFSYGDAMLVSRHRAS